MKKIILFSLISLLFLVSEILGQSTVTWNFGTSSGSASPSSGTPVSNLAISDVSQGNNNGTTTMLQGPPYSNGYTGSSGQYNAAVAARVGALSTGSSGSGYFEFTLTPTSGYIVTLTSISFGSDGMSPGPANYTLRNSADSYASNLATGTLTHNSTWALYSNTGLSIASADGTALTFRIYGYGGTGSPPVNQATWYIDDLSIGVTVSSSGPTPTITVGSITGFGNQAVSTTSSEKSYNVSGSNLTNDIVITPPAGFEISTTSGSGFVANPGTITLTQTGGTVSSTPIYVRFAPSAALAYSGNITNASTGATTQNVAVSGVGTINYYSKATGGLELVGNWGLNTDGSGTNPSNFTADGQIFNIRNNAAPTIGANWTVSGTSSKIIVGDGTNACNFTIGQTLTVTGSLDLSANSTLTLQNSTLTHTYGTIDANSTINFDQAEGIRYPICCSKYSQAFR
jgi:hypothetical protein